MSKTLTLTTSSHIQYKIVSSTLSHVPRIPMCVYTSCFIQNNIVNNNSTYIVAFIFIIWHKKIVSSTFTSSSIYITNFFFFFNNSPTQKNAFKNLAALIIIMIEIPSLMRHKDDIHLENKSLTQYIRCHVNMIAFKNNCTIVQNDDDGCGKSKEANKTEELTDLSLNVVGPYKILILLDMK